MASILAIVLSMSFGFRAVLFIALGMYVLGTAAMLAIPNRRA